MKKQRFRDLKQGKINTETEVSSKKSPKKQDETQSHYASSRDKIKAFLTDAFMIVMPILYVVIYFVMDGREDFAQHRVFGWLAFLGPLVLVQTAFMYFTGQTPGYRAYNITLIDERTQSKPSLFVIVFRNLSAVLSLFTLLGWALMFFRKDSKTLHDLLSATALVKTDEKRT
ncbi:MAG: RDD family protein [Sulfurovum sp.]|nr:RDD family protein [Sulfurovum sp.]